MSEHTPGPWRVDETVALGAYGVWTDYATHPGDDGQGYPSEVCSVYRGNTSDFDRPTRNANARLIAAAPQLLAACKEFIRKPTPASIALIMAAIDAAEGRS